MSSARSGTTGARSVNPKTLTHAQSVTATGSRLGPYRDYIDCLRRLHRYIRDGGGDSEAADALRDEMDTYWRRLSPVEVERTDQMSADLNTLTDPPQPTPIPLPADVQKSVYDALQTEQWEQVLTTVWKHRAALPLQLQHWLRFVAYRGLGEPDVAIDFGVAAVDAAPTDTRYVLSVVLYLVMLQRYHDALDVVEQHARPPADDWETAIYHGLVVFQTTRRMAEPQLHDTLTRAAGLIERGLGIARDRAPAGAPEVELGCLDLAACYWRLGQTQRGIEVLTAYLQTNPNSAEAFAWRGVLRRDTDRLAAMSDFEAAVRMGCKTTVVPYLYVAEERRKAGQFEEALRLCDLVYRVAMRDRYKGIALEWWALMKWQLGGAPDQIRDAFQRARRLHPESPTVEKNIKAFEQSAASGGSRTAQHESSIRLTIPDEELRSLPFDTLPRLAAVPP